jgi:hypothetical protein
MTFKDNPDFKCEFDNGKIQVYIPAELSSYHTQRYVAAMAQQIYSEAGATKDVLSAIMDNIIAICNDKDTKTAKTDIAVLANNIKYRLQYPVDEDCAIRMGAILSFMEGEDPNTISDIWTRKKVQLAHENQDLYTFFLTLGIVNTPEYKERLDTSIDMEYFNKRREVLAQLQPMSKG